MKRGGRGVETLRRGRKLALARGRALPSGRCLRTGIPSACVVPQGGANSTGRVAKARLAEHFLRRAQPTLVGWLKNIAPYPLVPEGRKNNFCAEQGKGPKAARHFSAKRRGVLSPPLGREEVATEGTTEA